MPLAMFHRRQMSGALRMVPSPLQGTSHRMRSNLTASSCQQHKRSAATNKAVRGQGLGLSYDMMQAIVCPGG